MKDLEQGNRTMQLLSNMKTLVRHQSLKAEETCVSMHKQSSGRDWKLQRPKTAAAVDRTVTGTDKTQHRLD